MIRFARVCLLGFTVLCAAGCSATAPEARGPATVTQSASHQDLWPRVELKQIELKNWINMMGNTHTSALYMDFVVRSREKIIPCEVESLPIIDQCIMSDGTDITQYQMPQMPFASTNDGFVPRGTYFPPDERPGSGMRVQFSPIPPRPYSAIRTLRGHVRASRATGAETVTIPFTEEACVTTPSGWTLKLLGIYSPDTQVFNSWFRVMITKGQGPLTTRFDAPRVVTMEALDAEGNLCAVVRNGAVSSAPGGITVEIKGGVDALPKHETTPIASVRIEFVSEVQQFDIPFEYHNIHLTR